jgi:hypothetical protein
MAPDYLLVMCRGKCREASEVPASRNIVVEPALVVAWE